MPITKALYRITPSGSNATVRALARVVSFLLRRHPILGQLPAQSGAQPGMLLFYVLATSLGIGHLLISHAERPLS